MANVITTAKTVMLATITTSPIKANATDVIKIPITAIQGSRMLYGMANHKSIPLFLDKIHSKTKTPSTSVMRAVLVMATASKL